MMIRDGLNTFIRKLTKASLRKSGLYVWNEFFIVRLQVLSGVIDSGECRSLNVYDTNLQLF
jgi:hypothetical protein